jgi:hypothetical protein
MSKTVTNVKHSSYTQTNDNNTNKDESLPPKKHQQTVRFTDHKNGKSKLKSSVTLVESDESIVSDASCSKYTSSYGSLKHVRMTVTLIKKKKLLI